MKIKPRAEVIGDEIILDTWVDRVKILENAQHSDAVLTVGQLRRNLPRCKIG